MEQYGALIRSKDSSQCAFSAVATWLFTRFHIKGEPFPNFSTPESWYGIKLFSSSDPKISIRYDTYNSSITEALATCSIISSSKTHCGRSGGTKIAENSGASESSIRRHGRWQTSALETSYMSDISREACRALAGFPVDSPTFFLHRAHFQPSEELKKKIFPSLEYWLERVPVCEPHMATRAFLNVLVEMRTTILQDAVEQIHAYPDWFIWQNDIFKSDLFLHFKGISMNISREESNPESNSIQIVAPQIKRSINDLTTSLNMNHSLLTNELDVIRKGQEKIISVQSTAFNYLSAKINDIKFDIRVTGNTQGFNESLSDGHPILDSTEARTSIATSCQRKFLLMKIIIVYSNSRNQFTSCKCGHRTRHQQCISKRYM